MTWPGPDEKGGRERRRIVVSPELAERLAGHDVDAVTINEEPPIVTLSPAQLRVLLREAQAEQRRRRKTAHPKAGEDAARRAQLKRERKRKRNREILARRHA